MRIFTKLLDGLGAVGLELAPGMRMCKRIVAGLVAFGLMLAPNPLFAQYGSSYYWWQVVDEFGKPYGGQSAVECSVYEVASHGAALMHFDATLGAGTGAGVTGNPNSPGSSQPLLGDATSRFHFYSQNTDDKRIICFAKRGGVANDVRLDRATHRIMIDRQGRKIARFAYTNQSSGVRTGVNIPQGSIIRDIVIQQSEPSYTSGGDAHINVGFAGNHLGATYHAFIRQRHLGQIQVTCSAQTSCDEWIRPGVLLGAARVGGDLFNQNTPPGIRVHIAGSHRGEKLATTMVGAFGNAVCSFGGIIDAGFCHYGLYIEYPYLVHIAGGIELTYNTSAASTTTPSLRGHVFVLYDQFHTGLDQSVTK